MSESTDPTGQPQFKRRQIAAEAAKYIGAHYVRGGCGAMPGGNDGVWYRPGLIEWVEPQIDNPAEAMVCAASCLTDKLHVCSGKYMMMGGRTFAADQGDLRNYLASLKVYKDAGQPQRSWPNIGGLTPRKANWKTPAGITTVRVWGEDCTDIRHFDCIGLVAYVLEKAVSKKLAVQRDISQYIGATKARDKTKPWPGDIATIDEEHIGIIFDENWVISATDGPHCVRKEEYVSSKWTRVGRFQDAEIL